LTIHRKFFAFAAVFVAAAVLAGCRAEEQGRPLVLKKGVYSGEKDTSLNSSQLSELKDRVALQGGGGIGGSAGPVAASSPRPGASGSTGSALNQRLRLQVGPPTVPSSTSVRPPGQPAARAPSAPSN